jgi:hypothetical protein
MAPLTLALAGGLGFGWFSTKRRIAAAPAALARLPA